MNRKLRSLFFQLILLVMGSYLITVFCNAQTEGFSLARIHSSLSYNPSWEVDPSSKATKEELEEILSQPFQYLGHGGQCFAFVSQDQRFVVKFFKHRLRIPYTLLYSLPGIASLSKRKIEKAHRKLDRDFGSYKIAYETLKEESGLIEIHLNKTSFPVKTMTLIDKLGIAHKISLDNIEFVIQKKGILAYDYFNCLLKSGDFASLSNGVRQTIELFTKRCQKGIFDEDPRIHRNLGFADGKPFFIDVGRFTWDPARKDPAVYRNDIQGITKGLRQFLNENAPELISILEQEV